MFNISFDFDELSQKISNIVISSNTKPTTRSKRKKVNGGKAVLEVDENKIILSDSMIEALGAEAGDRVTINYHTIDNQNTIPLIGKSEMFADKQSGNKLTKSNTVSFKGVQRDVLLQYGSLFTIEPFSLKVGPFTNKVFRLIPVESIDDIISANFDVNEELSSEQEDLDDLNTDALDEEIAILTDDSEF